MRTMRNAGLPWMSWVLLLLVAATQPAWADGIAVTGNTVLSAAEIQRVLAPYQGRAVTREELRNAAALLTRAYAKKGYFLTRAYVPLPEVQNGVAQLAVLEGRVGEVKMRGNRYHSPRLIRRFMAPVLGERVARHGTLQKAIMLLNEFPDLTVKARLRPGRERATTDVVLDVEDGTALHATVDCDNFGNRNVGMYRASLGLVHGNLTGRGDYLGVRGLQPFPSHNSPPVFQAGYTIPIDPEGRRLAAAYSNGLFVLGRDFAVLDVRSRASVYGLAYIDPWLRREDVSATFTAGFFTKSFSNSLAGIPNSLDEIREITLGCRGDWIAGTGRNIWSAALSQGLGGFMGGSANGNPLSSRPGAGDNFTIANFEFTRVQALGSPLSLIARAAGQISSTNLVVGEQFALGGPNTVRGYPLAELLGDSGYAVSAELRLPLIQKEHFNLQGAIFLDHGSVFLKTPTPGQPAAHFLTGAGLGLRGTSGQTTAVLEIGYPIYPAGNSTGTVPVLYAQFTSTF